MNMMLADRNTLPVMLIVLGLLAAAAPVRAQFQVSTVTAEQWGADDAGLGLVGGVVEDFEDYFLAPGLSLQLAEPNGQFTAAPLTVLPALFDPVNGDPFGTAFVEAVWDGSHVLLNIPGNESVYYGSSDYRAVRLNFPAGATWVAVAMQQVTVNQELFVNGQSLGRLTALGVPVVAGRNGLMIVTALDPSTPIVSLNFGGRGDAFCLDHVVFAPAGPVNVAATSWGSLKSSYAD